MKALRKPGRVALIACLLVALAGAWSGATFAAFTSKADNPGNVVTAAPDWKGPNVSGGGGKLNGPLGYIKQGDQVYLFLNVNDTGNPASGVATVTASVTVPGFGTLNMPMTAGTYTVRGQTYNYRSAPQATPPTFPEQTLNVNVTATDNAGNTTNATIPVVVDNTRPMGTNVQTANGNTIVGRAQQNDTITYTFNSAMDPYSILAGWNGSAQNVTVRLNDNATSGNDQVLIYNATNTTQLPLGSVNLTRTDYTAANRTFTNSSMVMSGSAITITLGTASGTTTTAALNGNMLWTPAAGATDLAGNPVMTAPVVPEAAPADREF